MTTMFRAHLQSGLSKLPFPTGSGRVVQGRPSFPQMGYPGGTHHVSELWRYLPHQGDLEMYFGFYDNFTPDDIICKVFSSWKELYRGMGASVQFNAGRCMTVSCLCHHGDVTVGKRISRSHLVSLIQTICPREMGMAGILGSWPVTIGDTTNIPRLIDQLFVYAYCIEQAKRYIRGEAPMLPLPQIKTPLVI